MSHAAQANIPDADSSFNNLYHGVRMKAFFHKLASHGLVPQNPAQAEAYVKIAEEVRAYKSQPHVKQAAASADPVLGALADLQAHLHGRTTVKQANDQLFADRAAQEFMNDPTLYNSVLSLKVAEAQEFAQAHGVAL